MKLKRSLWKWIATRVALPLALYLVSFGPICLTAAWFASWGLMPGWAEGALLVIYFPLEIAMAEWPSFGAAMNWYIELLRPLAP
jgi:hypothetical protein